MNKKILGLALAGLSVASIAQARFFMGLEGGYTTTSLEETSMKEDKANFYASAYGPKIVTDTFKNGARGYSAALTLGTENFFGNYFGIRSAVFGGYTSTSKKIYGLNKEFNLIDAGLSFDLMLNFFSNGNSSFGIFGGAEAGYHYWYNKKDFGSDILYNSSDVSKHLLDFSGRFGISTLVGGHHRIELFTKVPFASMGFSSSSEAKLGGLAVPLNVSVGASYKFVF